MPLLQRTGANAARGIFSDARASVRLHFCMNHREYPITPTIRRDREIPHL
jgi:hypothetical protein